MIKRTLLAIITVLAITGSQFLPGAGSLVLT